MAKRRLYLIRHGQYMASPALPDEPPDGGLTAIGQEQALLTALRLNEFPISIIHHSTLQRANETATIMARQFPAAPMQPSDLLCECIPSVPSVYKAHFEHIPPHFIASGGAQARQVFDTYFVPLPDDAQEDQHEIIVSSGNLISYLVCRVLGAPEDAWMQTDIQYCGVTEVHIGPPRHVMLMRHNDTGHLPAPLRMY
jgi:broad specificity phosphatase PhoE